MDTVRTYEVSRASYRPQDLAHYVGLARRQEAKDRAFLRRVRPYLRSGTVLELGAACGQLAAILTEMGFQTTASDVQPFFVDYMASRGLAAALVDATDIQASLPRTFDNVVAQAISPLVCRDAGVIRRCYASIHRALPEGGRLLFVFPNARRRARWSTLDDHVPVIREIGFRTVALFRDQVLPSAAYRLLPDWLTGATEETAGRRWGVRHVIVLER
jgi:SAM-dependent methyltransferase